MTIAWGADALPEFPSTLVDAWNAEPEPEAEPAPDTQPATQTPQAPDPDEEPPDQTPAIIPGQTLAPDDEPGEPDAPVDVPDEPDEPAATPRVAIQAFVLHSPEVAPHVASIIAGQLIGDETPELVVGLGDRVDVLQFDAGRLHRVATIRIEQPDPNFVPSTPRAAIGDVSGDGQADLLIPYWRRTVGGGSRGGGAVILRGKADGSLDRPRRFAGPRMMVSSLALMDLDGRGGLDIVLGGRGRPFGEIPGRLVFYRGGRMPRLIREVRTDVTEIRFVFPVDINDDDDRDLLVVGNTLVRYRRTHRDRFEALEDTQSGILFADPPHALGYPVPGTERREALVLANSAYATVVVNGEGMNRVADNFEAGQHDVRLSWVRAVIPERGGEGREVLAIHYVTHGWVLGRLDEHGEPVDMRPLHGGHPRSGVDGALVEEDGEQVVYGLEQLWDHETGATTWHILRFPFCACDFDRLEPLEIQDRDDIEEWTIH